MDAVESSRFITAKKSERLIEKLGKLTSESHARQLDRHIYMEGTAKPENECIYYSVDEIHNAIQEKRQITFQYYEYTPQKEKILKHNGYRYQFSPYALIWSRDCYYAVGWSEKHGKIAQFRVDRMTAVEPLEHTAVQTPDFDPAEYVRKVFGMYPDNLCTVELLCDNEVMRSVIDRFGENVQTEVETEQMLDLAAKSQNNRVSADLPDYIMNREIVRAALRTAKEADATDQEWQEFIDRITQRAKKSKEGGEIDA